MFARQNVPAKSSISNNVILEVFRKLQHSPATNSILPVAGPHALRVSTSILKAQAPGEPTVALVAVWGCKNYKRKVICSSEMLRGVGPYLLTDVSGPPTGPTPHKNPESLNDTEAEA